MEYNPYKKEYSNLKDLLEDRKNKKQWLTNELNWYNSTDISNLYLLLDRKEQDKANIQSLIISIEKEIDVLHGKIQKTKNNVKTLLNPLNWFDHKQKTYRNTLKTLNEELKLKERNKSLREKLLSEINGLIDKYKREINKYNSFDAKEIGKEIAELTKKINSIEDKIRHVYELKSKVDDELRPTLLVIENIKSEISTAKNILSTAMSFEKDLDNAGNSYERAMVHQECEDVLGEGSPRKIIREQERKIRQFERDLEKAHKRAIKIGQKASRNIQKLVIDGNNMCYEGNRFVGLGPLKTLTTKLQKQYQVIIVFDSAIRSQLKADDQAIKNNFNSNIGIHIVATKQLADETILDIASEDNLSYIISNDRFGEYKEKVVVKQDRIIRHEIVDGRVMVHDLNINEKYG